MGEEDKSSQHTETCKSSQHKYRNFFSYYFQVFPYYRNDDKYSIHKVTASYSHDKKEMVS